MPDIFLKIYWTVNEHHLAHLSFDGCYSETPLCFIVGCMDAHLPYMTCCILFTCYVFIYNLADTFGRSGIN